MFFHRSFLFTLVIDNEAHHCLVAIYCFRCCFQLKSFWKIINHLSYHCKSIIKSYQKALSFNKFPLSTNRLFFTFGQICIFTKACLYTIIMINVNFPNIIFGKLPIVIWGDILMDVGQTVSAQFLCLVQVNCFFLLRDVKVPSEAAELVKLTGNRDVCFYATSYECNEFIKFSHFLIYDYNLNL